MIDDLVENKNRNDKEPKKLNLPPTIYEQRLNNVYLTAMMLTPDLQGFFIHPDVATFDLIKKNALFSLSISELEFKKLKSIRLVLNGSYFSSNTAPGFGSDFSFDVFYQVIKADSSNNYQPLLQIKVGTINYTNTTGVFSSLEIKRTLNLSDVINSQTFNQQEQTQITQTQYSQLSDDRIVAYLGYSPVGLTAAQQNFINLFGLSNNLNLSLLYYGESIITINDLI
ncbi:MAG: hypothetical protein ACRDBG_23945 [Waterburya sp.]